MRFTEDNKHVFVYDKASKQLRRDTPKNIAVEKDYNSVIMRDGSKANWIEVRLSEIESVVFPALDKLERGVALTSAERWHISFFIGFTESRSRGFRNSIDGEKSVDSRLIDIGIDERFSKAYQAATGVWLDPSTLERMIKEDLSEISTGVDWVVGMASVGFELAKYVFHMNWFVNRAPAGAEVVTCDRPFMYIDDEPTFTDRLREDNLYKLFPLSKRAVLIIGKLSNLPIIAYDDIPAVHVKTLNYASATKCDRYLIGPSEAVVTEALDFARSHGKVI